MKRSRFTEEQIINQSFCIEVTRYHTYHKWHYLLSHLPIHRQIAGNRQTPELAKENARWLLRTGRAALGNCISMKFTP